MPSACDNCCGESPRSLPAAIAAPNTADRAGRMEAALAQVGMHGAADRGHGLVAGDHRLDQRRAARLLDVARAPAPPAPPCSPDAPSPWCSRRRARCRAPRCRRGRRRRSGRRAARGPAPARGRRAASPPAPPRRGSRHRRRRRRSSRRRCRADAAAHSGAPRRSSASWRSSLTKSTIAVGRAGGGMAASCRASACDMAVLRSVFA